MNLEENPAIQPAQNTGIQLDIPLPGKFEGAYNPQQSELWTKWLKRFERYRVASGLKNKPNADQVSILLYSMGDALSDSLQAKSDLSLKKAIELSRQAEARKHNREYVRENTAATNKTVDYVKPAHAINKHKAGAKPKAKNYPTADSSTTTRTHSCKWCGRSRHDRRHCPAREAICRNCQRKGHFHSVCRGEKVFNRVNEVQQLGSVDLPYLGYVGAKCDNTHFCPN